MTEIVALRFGSTITNNREEILERLERGDEFDVVPRTTAQFMSSMDLGKHWQDLADAPTLFVLDENGQVVKDSL